MRYEVISRPRLGYTYPKIISLDTEYSDLNIRKAELQSISIGVSPDQAYILHDRKCVDHFISQSDIILSWNMVVDQYMLDKSGYPSPREKWIDGMLLEHLIDERLDHGLGDYALREYQDDYKSKFWKDRDSFLEAPEEDRNQYEMRDACYTYRAGIQYLEKLRASGKSHLIPHVHKLQWSLFDTEITGIKVDQKLIERTHTEMSQRIQGYLPELRRRFDRYCHAWELKKFKEELDKRSTDAGKANVKRPKFSFSSDPQLRWMLYDAMKLPVINKTKKGSAKVDYDTLEELCREYSQLRILADYKQDKSLFGTFVEGMLTRIEDGRIYPRFNINGTTTGRISHSNPNMANLPTSGVFRQFFLPDEDYVILGVDWSQLEVVIEANLTNDPTLLKIILEGANKHDLSANGLSISRDLAKKLNFSAQYGAGVGKIAKILNMSRQDAEKVYDNYWKLYTGVKALKDQTAKTLEAENKITNCFGRTRHFTEPTNEYEKAKNERKAYNHLIQGPGADMTNMAAYLLSDKLKSSKIGRLLFTVHDELVCEVRKDLIEEGRQCIIESMEETNEYFKRNCDFKHRVAYVVYGPYTEWRKG